MQELLIAFKKKVNKILIIEKKCDVYSEVSGTCKVLIN